jgi:hypothetical protein
MLSSTILSSSIYSNSLFSYEKIFEHHIVNETEDGTILLYIGEHKYPRFSPTNTLTDNARPTSDPRSHFSSMI